MPEHYANHYQTALAAGVTSGALTGTVTSATGIPAVPFRAIIGAEGANTGEIVLVTGAAGTTLTWTRAAEAIAGVQVASAHAIGATLTAVVTAAGLDAFVSYSRTVLGMSGLRSYWPLTETTGTRAVDAKGVSPGTYTGSPILGVAGLIVAEPTPAVTFAPTQYASVGTDASLAVTTAVSVVAWVKFPVGTAATTHIFSKRSGGVAGYQLSVTSGGRLYGFIGDGSTFVTDFLSTPSLFDGAIHCVAMARAAGGGLWGYVDGLPALSIAAPSVGSMTTSATAAIGAHIAGGELVITGTVGHIAVFDRALTVAEIAYLNTVGRRT